MVIFVGYIVFFHAQLLTNDNKIIELEFKKTFLDPSKNKD
jgi:hypothetical protein